MAFFLKLQKLYRLISVKIVTVTLSRETFKNSNSIECLGWLRTSHEENWTCLNSFFLRRSVPSFFFLFFFSWNEKAIVQVQPDLGLFSILFSLESKQAVLYKQCNKTIITIITFIMS